MKYKLEHLGLNEELRKEYEEYKNKSNEELILGRVALEHRGMYKAYTEAGELLVHISGKMGYKALDRVDYPAVGDWVIISPQTGEEKGVIKKVLKRKSKFSRKVAGTEQKEQIIASNIDTLFLVMSLNQDFNTRRLERYLTMAYDSGANPVIVLTKKDLCADIDKKKYDVENVAYGVPIITTSTVTNEGIEEIKEMIKTGKTIALTGSSGVGKSSLINSILGEDKMKTKEIREDDGEGKHTTTHRELLLIPEGGILIDTPGMRELQLWATENDTISQSFQDITDLALKCKFRDCSHDNEPDCAVLKAINEGNLEEKRYKSYLKLQKEMEYIEDKTAYLQKHKEKHKNISKHMRNNKKK